MLRMTSVKYRRRNWLMSPAVTVGASFDRIAVQSDHMVPGK